MPQPSLAPSHPRQGVIVYATPEALAADPGPRTDTRFALALSLGAVFSWSIFSEATADGETVIAPSGGGVGRWIRSRAVEQGDDLGDASATITISGGRWRVLPAATLTADRTLTIDDAGAVEGDEILVTRNGIESFKLTLANGGAGAGTIAAMPSGSRAWCLMRFDGTNWIHAASGVALGTS